MYQTLEAKPWSAQKILKILEEQSLKLQSLGVYKLGLFGSYLRGTAKLQSDIDFLVVFAQPSFDTYMDTKIFLEDLFECKVDLILEEDLKPRLRSHILNEVSYVSGL